MQTPKALDPATHIGRGRLDSRKGGPMILFHLLLLEMVLSSFRFYPYRVPHLEEKEGLFFDAFPTLIAVLISATVVR